MALANSPLWQHLLLEQPWPLVIALAATAVVMTLVAQRRRSRALRIMAWVIAIGAGTVYGLATYTTTAHEQLRDQTRELVAATHAPMDVPMLMARWLRDGAVLVGPDGAPWLESEQIEQSLAQIAEHNTIEGHTVRGLDVIVPQPGRGRSRVELSTQLNTRWGNSRPLHSLWEIDWRRNDEGQWQAQTIRWISFRGERANRRLLNAGRR